MGKDDSIRTFAKRKARTDKTCDNCGNIIHSAEEYYCEYYGLVNAIHHYYDLNCVPKPKSPENNSENPLTDYIL
jgi:hypothetical protein